MRCCLADLENHAACGLECDAAEARLALPEAAAYSEDASPATPPAPSSASLLLAVHEQPLVQRLPSARPLRAPTQDRAGQLQVDLVSDRNFMVLPALRRIARRCAAVSSDWLQLTQTHYSQLDGPAVLQEIKPGQRTPSVRADRARAPRPAPAAGDAPRRRTRQSRTDTHARSARCSWSEPPRV